MIHLRAIILAVVVLIAAVALSAYADATDPIVQMFGPITLGANNTVSVYGRDYVLGNGFISSVKIFGGEALDGPVSLIVKNSGVPESFIDQSITVTQQSSESVTFAVTAQSANVDLTNTVLIENDGFVYFTCQVTPRAGRALDCLRVVFPIKHDLALLYGTSPMNEQGYNYADSAKHGYLTDGNISMRRAFDVWPGDNTCGVQVFGGEDIATWSGWTAADALLIYKTSSTAGVKFDVEPNSTYLRSPYSFQFGLIATPVKNATHNPNVRMGFGDGAANDIYSDMGQAQMPVTKPIDPKNSVLSAGFVLHDVQLGDRVFAVGLRHSRCAGTARLNLPRVLRQKRPGCNLRGNQQRDHAIRTDKALHPADGRAGHSHREMGTRRSIVQYRDREVHGARQPSNDLGTGFL